MHWELTYSGGNVINYSEGFDRLIAKEAYDATIEATHRFIELCVRQKFEEIVRYQPDDIDKWGQE